MSRRQLESHRLRTGVKVDVFSWAIASWEIWTLKGKPYAGLDIDQHMYHAVQQNERPAVPTQARRPSTTLLGGPRRRRAHTPRGLGRAGPTRGEYGLLRHRVSLQTFLVVPFPFPYRHAVDVD